MWDETTNNQLFKRQEQDRAEKPFGRDRRKHGTLELGDIKPSLEGRWIANTLDGEVEVTTVFELLKEECENYTPQMASEITGVSPKVIEQTARVFADAQPGMIYAGYASCKWLHGDLLQRAMLLMLALTGSTGKEGGGLQIANSPNARGMTQFGFSDVGPAFRLISGTTWDYDHADMKELNSKIYGNELAEKFDRYYKKKYRRRLVSRLQPEWLEDGNICWK